MSLYEYSCQKCSQKIELLVRGDEKPVCPHCQSTKLTKLLSVVSGHVSNSGGDPGTGGTCGRPQCGMGGCAGPAAAARRPAFRHQPRGESGFHADSVRHAEPAAGAGRHPRCLGDDRLDDAGHLAARALGGRGRPLRACAARYDAMTPNL